MTRGLASRREEDIEVLGLLVSRWEYKELYEKDSRFNVVQDGVGNPKVGDAWVTLYLRAEDGTEIPMDVDRPLFDEFLLPRLGECKK